MEQNFLKVMKAINQQSLLSKPFMLFEKHWARKQKIIQWWSTWPGRNAVLTRCCYLWRSVQQLFFLMLTLVAPLRNWLNSTKSPKRLHIFNFNLEYEICELMWPKLFNNFSCIKWKPNVFWTDFLIFFLSVLPSFSNKVSWMS